MTYEEALDATTKAFGFIVQIVNKEYNIDPKVSYALILYLNWLELFMKYPEMCLHDSFNTWALRLYNFSKTINISFNDEGILVKRLENR